MKILAALLLSLTLLGCASAPLPPGWRSPAPIAPTFADIPEELYTWGDTYVWSVKRYGEGEDRRPVGFMGHGSGVWIDDTLMVTACHVPSMHKEVWASPNGNDEGWIDLIVNFCHRLKDQAVLSVVEGYHRVDPVVFGNLPERGERVYILGYPADSPLTVTTGWFVGKSVMRSAGDDSEWTLAAQAMGGNSGGAVVVIRDNEIQLVGILISGYPTGDIVQMKDLEYTRAWLASPPSEQ